MCRVCVASLVSPRMRGTAPWRSGDDTALPCERLPLVAPRECGVTLASHDN